jgi:hypothetical protein
MRLSVKSTTAIQVDADFGANPKFRCSRGALGA